MVLATWPAMACTAVPASVSAVGTGACPAPWAGDVIEPTPKYQALPSDAGGVCFEKFAPAPDAFVADVPIPTSDPCPDMPPPACGGAPALEVAVVVPPAVTPAEASPWAGIAQGAQGFAHVWLTLEVTLPGAVTAKRKVAVRGWLCVGGRLVGEEQRTMFVRSLGPADGAGARYTSMDAEGLGATGVRLVIPALPALALSYCGAWAVARLQVVDAESGAWGQGEASMRLFAEPLPGHGP
jgi:hypothetical protein